MPTLSASNSVIGSPSNGHSSSSSSSVGASGESDADVRQRHRRHMAELYHNLSDAAASLAKVGTIVPPGLCGRQVQTYCRLKGHGASSFHKAVALVFNSGATAGRKHLPYAQPLPEKLKRPVSVPVATRLLAGDKRFALGELVGNKILWNTEVSGRKFYVVLVYTDDGGGLANRWVSGYLDEDALKDLPLGVESRAKEEKTSTTCPKPGEDSSGKEVSDSPAEGKPVGSARTRSSAAASEHHTRASKAGVWTAEAFWSPQDMGTPIPSTLYIKSVTYPPSCVEAEQVGPGPVTDKVSRGEYGFFRTFEKYRCRLTDTSYELLETQPSLLKGACLAPDTVLYCRKTEHPLDPRLNADGAIRLAAIRTLECEEKIYVIAEPHVFIDSGLTYEWAYLRQSKATEDHVPDSGSECLKVHLVDGPRKLGDPSRRDVCRNSAIRADYSALARIIPPELVGPVNDQKMELLATPDCRHQPHELVMDLLATHESILRCGAPLLGWGNA